MKSVPMHSIEHLHVNCNKEFLGPLSALSRANGRLDRISRQQMI